MFTFVAVKRAPVVLLSVRVVAVFCGDVDCSSVHTQTDDVISPCPPDSFRPEPLVTQDGCCVVQQRSRDPFFLFLICFLTTTSLVPVEYSVGCVCVCGVCVCGR